MKQRIIIAALSMLFAVGQGNRIIAQDILDQADNAGSSQPSIMFNEPVKYDNVREADVLWKKRIWRTIDLREKLNLPFAYPKHPLIEIIHTAASSGDLVVYENLPNYGYDFLTVLPADKVQQIGNSVDTQIQVNPITLIEEPVIITQQLDWNDVTKYRLKEDWFFDSETSNFQVRIVALAPVREVMHDGVYIGDEIMYWIFYPDLRPLLSKYFAFNPKNDASALSWEDVFEARLFASYITMENNVLDRTIADYATGLNALMESERIKYELYSFENDLWND